MTDPIVIPAQQRRAVLSLGPVENCEEGWKFGLLDQHGQSLAILKFRHEEGANQARAAVLEAVADAIPHQVAGHGPEGERNPEIAVLPGSAQADGGGARQWTHTLLEEGQLDSFAGRVIEGLLITLIVANVAAVALETIPFVYSRFAPLFTAFEEFSLAAYTIEYVARIWSAVEDPRIAVQGAWRGRLYFALRPLMVVDFLAFAPSFLGLFFGIDLRVLRIFRLFRLLKLARYSQALQALLGVLLAERSALFASAILLLATTCLYGELMHLAEGAVQPNTLGTMPGAMYWAITTLTTVGYGDIAPMTPLGKFIAGIAMVTGLALFALPIGIIANGFVTGLSRRRFAITWSMLRRQPLFHGFDVDSLNIILEAPTAMIVREHSQIIVEGRHADAFYLVVSGVARVEQAGEEFDLGPGRMFGEQALYHSSTYDRTVTAETDMRVIT
ncbi:MAG TPA: cyclic nucleotide-gated ion channel, partial [Rhizomicrobium sp.]|nr:cyclic nucleotide-gated ion channel [Rhizomicrobium sp.]